MREGIASVESLRPMRAGLVLSLLTVLFGFGLGGVFGAFEDSLKGNLRSRAEAVRESVYGNDEAKLQATVDKSWTYYKRAHLHGGGIGAVSLAAILLLGALPSCRHALHGRIALGLGLGGLGYANFWLLAGTLAPGLGSTGKAREALSWLALPTAGLLLISLGAVLVLVIVELFRPRRGAV